MNDLSYSKTIVTEVSPAETLKKICDVQAWWAKSFEGKSKEINDVFTVKFKNGDRYKLKIVDIVPEKKLVWDVIDAHQTWVQKPTEWVGTKIVWELKEKPGGTEIHFTHEGLVPELECFKNCQDGWNYLMLESLAKLLSKGAGSPQPRVA